MINSFSLIATLQQTIANEVGYAVVDTINNKVSVLLLSLYAQDLSSHLSTGGESGD